MWRIVFAALLTILCTACGNVNATAPTAVPPPIDVKAQLIGQVDMMVTVTNNGDAPLQLGGWTMQITPVVSPTLVAPLPFPPSFTLEKGKEFDAHTTSGTNTDEQLFFDSSGQVPPQAWSGGVLVQMRDPKSDQAITRYVYRYTTKQEVK